MLTPRAHRRDLLVPDWMGGCASHPLLFVISPLVFARIASSPLLVVGRRGGDRMELLRRLSRSLQDPILGYLSADDLQDVRIGVVQDESIGRLVDDHVYGRISRATFAPRRRKFGAFAIAQVQRAIRDRSPIPDERTFRNLLSLFLMADMHDVLALCTRPPTGSA